MRGLRFTDAPYVARVSETPVAGAPIDPTLPPPVTGLLLRVQCTHQDGTPVSGSNSLNYSIDGTNYGRFHVNSVNGDFSVSAEPFDYEKNTSYLVGLLCYLKSDPNNFGTGSVNISILPVNEYVPEITSSQYFFSIFEDTNVGTVLASPIRQDGATFTYTAKDQDEGPDKIIIYYLDGENANDTQRIQQFFDIDKYTGRITLKQALELDDLLIETPFLTLHLSITACNDGIPFSSCKNIAPSVFITTSNDNDPMFLQPQYSARINESASNGTLVGQVLCEDKDKGVGKLDSIELDPRENDIFEVTSTGAILLRYELDYENITSYQLTVVCSDGFNIDTAHVDVTILPVNDNAPTFPMDIYDISARRDTPSPADKILYTFQAEDADQDIGSTITYSLSSSSHFEIDSESGELTMKDYVYTEEGGAFEFNVIASDGEFETTAKVRVSLTGLLSVPEWSFVGLGGVGLLIILVVIGLVVLHFFIRAARVRIKYKER